jgi:hypothetical protein
VAAAVAPAARPAVAPRPPRVAPRRPPAAVRAPRPPGEARGHHRGDDDRGAVGLPRAQDDEREREGEKRGKRGKHGERGRHGESD